MLVFVFLLFENVENSKSNCSIIIYRQKDRESLLQTRCERMRDVVSVALNGQISVRPAA